MTNKVNERELVLEGLIDITENKVFSHIAINQLLSKYQGLDKVSRAFISRVIIGTLEHLLEIDYIINQFSNVKVNKMKPIIRNVLRSGVYQLKYMSQVPPSAVCDEAVKITRKRGLTNLTGFVNGNLRNIARNLENISYPEDKLSHLEVKYSIPSWILKLWAKEYTLAGSEDNSGWDIIEKIAKSFQEKQPLTIRVNKSKIAPEVLKANLEACGIVVEEHPYLNYAFKVSGMDYLGGLEDFKRGNFYVQDVSSMLVGELTKPTIDSVIIDCCAAPRGKTLHIADIILESEIHNATRIRKTGYEHTKLGSIFAWDLTDKKVSLIIENTERVGFDNIIVSKKDATILHKEFVEKADIVIADVPCSGLGTIGKKPDLRYNSSAESIEELVKIQRKILANACAYVKPQGILMFSTCTISPKENIENVKWLLESFPKFKLLPVWDELPEKLKEELEKYSQDNVRNNTLQLLPGINESDGFFIAKFKKNPQKV
jgi:16S rRNA (cytosine967-C5)-methyltransferase